MHYCPSNAQDKTICVFCVCLCELNRSVVEQLRSLQFFTDSHQIFTPLVNVVDSTPIVIDVNRKWLSGFRSLQIPTLAVLRLRLPRLFKDRHKNPNTVKINQH